MSDPYHLDRFVVAQRDSYEGARAEIAQGDKRGHWMWFIFPQIAGLGRSAMATHYAIASLAEARAYLAHPLLGPRLIACIDALQGLRDMSVERVFGGIDALKLRSSLTLFEAAGGPPSIAAALDRWYGGDRDDATLERLGHIG